MPKKRKKRKKSSASRSKKNLQNKSQADAVEQEKNLARSELEKIFLEDSQNRGIRGRVLYKVVEFSPLLAGSIAGGSGLYFNLSKFYLLFLFFALSSGLALILRISALKGLGRDITLKHLIIYIGSLAALLFFLKDTGSIFLTAFAFTLYLFLLYIDNFQTKDKKTTYQLICMQPLLMAGLSALAYLAQKSPTLDFQLIYPALLSGLFPGLYLSAAIMSFYLPILKKSKDDVQRKVLNKKEEIILRPGVLTKIFSLLLFLPLGISIILVPLGFLPSSFLLFGVLFYFLPNLAKDFLEEGALPEAISLKTLKVAFLFSVLSLAGFLLYF